MFLLSSPFSVSPDHNHIDVDSCIHLVLGFLPLKTEDHTGYLRVHYDTGMSQRKQTKSCSQTS